MNQKIVAILLFIFNLFVNVRANANCKIDSGDRVISEFENAVRLHIFTTKGKYETLEVKQCHLDGINLNKNCKSTSRVKLIVHGFMERWNMKTRWNWIEDLKNELFDSPDSNNLCIIAVDWKELGTGGEIPNYWQAISNMKIAGELISTVLNNSNIDIKKTHCVGFSLGAHMCSILLKTYFNRFNVKVGRLTGLDP